MSQDGVQRGHNILERGNRGHKRIRILLQEGVVGQRVGNLQRTLGQKIALEIHSVRRADRRVHHDRDGAVRVVLRARHFVVGQGSQGLLPTLIDHLRRSCQRVRSALTSVHKGVGQRCQHCRVKVGLTDVVVQGLPLRVPRVRLELAQRIDGTHPRKCRTNLGLTQSIVLRSHHDVRLVELLDAVHVTLDLVPLESRGASFRHEFLVGIRRLFFESVKADLLRSLNGLIKFNVLEDLELLGGKVQHSGFHYTDPRTFSHSADASALARSTTASG